MGKLFFTEPLSAINAVIATLNPQGTGVHESFDDKERKVIFPDPSAGTDKHLAIDMCKIPHETRGTDFYIWRGAILGAGYDAASIDSDQMLLYLRAAEDLARENSAARDYFKGQALAAKEKVSGLTDKVATLSEQLMQRNNQLVDLQSNVLAGKSTRNMGSIPTTNVLRVKDIPLPTFDGEMSVSAVHSFLDSLERGLRAASLQSFGVEVPDDTTVWGARAILQLRDSATDTTRRAAEWANGLWKPSTAKPTWEEFKKALQDRFIPSAAKQRTVREFDNLVVPKGNSRIDGFNQEFNRLVSHVELATGSKPPALLASYIKKIERAANKEKLYNAYDLWLFDREERKEPEMTLEMAMRWMERADERTYHKTGRFSSTTTTHDGSKQVTTTTKTTDPDPDAMDWEANAIKAGWKPTKRADGRTKTPEDRVKTAAWLKEQTCYNCEGKGHLARECPSPKKLRGQTGGSPSGQAGSSTGRQTGGPMGGKTGGTSKINATKSSEDEQAGKASGEHDVGVIDGQNEGEESVLDSDVEELSCTSLSSNTNNLLWFNGQVRWWDGESSSRSQQAVHTLLDNGASENFVSRRIAEKLRADGCEYKKTGWMRVKVANDARPQKQKRETVKVMTILDMDEYDIILGKPWYTEMNLRHTIDYERNVMWIHKPRGGATKEMQPQDETNLPDEAEPQWEGMLIGLRPWEGKGKKSEVQRDMDSINSILNNVEIVWSNSSSVEKQAKKRGFLVRLRLMDDKGVPPGMTPQNRTLRMFLQHLPEYQSAGKMERLLK
ncbi:hypothetical protein FN846DRAFT_889315 [Sphaerosporella brunnea]|uniref:CCHC-type domain-containing protein n=1 Tax=Sphaerosporella brunnea TaxID=1250544 RepID=A0A5J5F0D2_9PEZI|nr:hypothetical protein FN846DRAFT_889315 [Sphaerosporella brunnea]